MRVAFKLATGNRIRHRFGDVAFDVEHGVFELCFGLCELGFRLIQHGLKRSWIDLEEDVVYVDEGTFAIVLLDQVPGDMWLDLCVDIPIQRGDTLAVDTHVPLSHAYDLHLRRGRG